MARERNEHLVRCGCWGDHVSMELRNCGYFSLALSVIGPVTMILPYIYAVTHGKFPAVLPIISLGGGLPPMSGIFVCGLALMGFCGTIVAFLVFQTIKQRNVKKSRLIMWLNRTMMMFWLIICLGAVVCAPNLLCFLDVVNQYTWLTMVFIPHAIGALMILLCAPCFQFFLTLIAFLLPDVNKLSKLTKLAILMGYIIVFCVELSSLEVAMKEMTGFNEGDLDYMKTVRPQLPTKFSTEYVVVSIAEWSFCILLALQFGLDYFEMRRVSLRVVIRHKSCLLEPTEERPKLETYLN